MAQRSLIPRSRRHLHHCEGETVDKIDVSDLSSDRLGWTLLATLYLRAWDSRNRQPILGDEHAAAALECLRYDEAMLRRRTRPEVNQYLVGLRARLLDDWAANYLSHRPDAVVVQLGCGLDSRMLRLDQFNSTLWLDVDLPDVIAVRRRLYPERQRYQMIAASATDPKWWWEEVPTDRPVLVIAEGLLMYLPPDEVRQLLGRIASRSPSGQLLFDGVAPWLTHLSRAVHWGIRDGSEIEAWNPRLRCLEQVSLGAHYKRIPNRAVRTIYRMGDPFPSGGTCCKDFGSPLV